MFRKTAIFFACMITMLCFPVMANAEDNSNVVEIVSHEIKGASSGNWQVEYKVQNISDETISDVILNGIVYDDEGDIRQSISFMTQSPVQPEQSVYITFYIPEYSSAALEIPSYSYTDSNGVYKEDDFSVSNFISFVSPNDEAETETVEETEVAEEENKSDHTVSIISSEVTELTDDLWTVECTIKNNTAVDLTFAAISSFVYNDQKDRLNASNAELDSTVKPGETGTLTFTGTETNAKYMQYYNYSYSFADGSFDNGEFDAQDAVVVELINQKMLEAPILTKDDFVVTSDDPESNIDDLFLNYDGDIALELDSLYREGGYYWYTINREIPGIETPDSEIDFCTNRGILLEDSTMEDVLEEYGIGVNYNFDYNNDPIYGLFDNEYFIYILENYATEIIYYTYKDHYQLAFFMDATGDVIGIVFTNDVFFTADKDTVQYVQETLNSLGYDCGTADGVAGSNTAAAVQKYQEDHGLFVSGVIDDELLKNIY